MTKIITQNITANCKTLKLPYIPEIVDEYCNLAIKNNTPPLELINNLIESEVLNRKENSLNRKIKLWRFPKFKSIEDFDFSFQPSLDKKKILWLTELSFINQKENVIFLWPPWVWKTHLAASIWIIACKNNISTLFINANTLADDLLASMSDNSISKRINQLFNIDLLIVDELWYWVFDKTQANLFFKLISERYEKKSTIITSNKNFKEWWNLFSDSVIATAILDRVLHHSHVISIKGESFRLREKKDEIK